MTRDDIIRMAREAEFPVFDAKVTATNSLDQVIAETVTNHYHEGAIRFAALVAAAEREACAKYLEGYATRFNDIRSAALEVAAENLRARGQV